VNKEPKIRDQLNININQITPAWASVVQRLQGAASKDNHGAAIVSISIVVDELGRPYLWSEPVVVKLEPRKRSMGDILAILSCRSPNGGG
jgi:hypothetical protein